MTVQSASTSPPVNKFYFAAWRWHFYAGIFVIPFLVILAVSGAFMTIYANFGNSLGYAPDVPVAGETQPVSVQAEAALAAVPDGTLATYVAPEAPERPAYVEIIKGDAYFAVAVDPYTGAVLGAHDEASTYYALAEKIHGTLLLGTAGDRIIEAAASLSMVLIATGLYMWWPRGRSFPRALVPSFSARGRNLWKQIHMTVGAWISLVLVLFLLSGLAWSGIWGDKFVQPWSSFPAEKWDNVPLSDASHASLNHGVGHEVPWGLEQTPLPASGSAAGTAGVPVPVTLDSVAQWAEANGFHGQYKLSVPNGPSGVFTVSLDGRNEDGVTPSGDRFVHIDQYTGNVLADVGYADYEPVGKLMAWGIGLHKGMAGTWNFIFNLVFIALLVLLCVAGAVMWWKRRPSGAGRLAAPPMPAEMPLWKGAVLVGLATCLAFPLAGITLLLVLAVDMLLVRHVPALQRALS